MTSELTACGRSAGVADEDKNVVRRMSVRFLTVLSSPCYSMS